MVLLQMNGVHSNLSHTKLNSNIFSCLSLCLSFLLFVFFNAYGSDNRKINNFKEAQMSIKLMKSLFSSNTYKTEFDLVGTVHITDLLHIKKFEQLF